MPWHFRVLRWFSCLRNVSGMIADKSPNLPGGCYDVQTLNGESHTRYLQMEFKFGKRLKKQELRKTISPKLRLRISAKTIQDK